MRTGTITFHAPNNNGSFLQAFALQQILIRELGVENEIINFRSEKQTNQYKTFRKIRGINDLLKNLAAIPHFKKLNRRYMRFENMRDEYLIQTSVLMSEEDALRKADQYDVVIAGSDQIWNTGAPDFSKAYFLPDVSADRITYAVSCGSLASETGLKDYQKPINEFKSISVRESAVQKHLSLNYDGEISLVLDPTLLLEKSDYQRLYSEKPLVKEKYIFYYSINYSKDSLEAVRNMSRITGLPVYTVFTSFHTDVSRKYGLKVIYDAGPGEFLNLIENAEIVASNSFHGTAFSLIYEKDFYYLCNVVDGKVKRDDRIDGLLEQIGLENRNYSYLQNQMLPKTSYSESDLLLKKLRSESIQWLKIALNNHQMKR